MNSHLSGLIVKCGRKQFLWTRRTATAQKQDNDRAMAVAALPWRQRGAHQEQKRRARKPSSFDSPFVHSFVKTDYFVMKFVSCGTNLTDYDDDL